MVYIGKKLKERMYLLDMNIHTLVESTQIGAKEIRGLRDDRISCEEFGYARFAALCDVLGCTPDYFTDVFTYDRDLFVAGKRLKGLVAGRKRRLGTIFRRSASAG